MQEAPLRSIFSPFQIPLLFLLPDRSSRLGFPSFPFVHSHFLTRIPLRRGTRSITSWRSMFAMSVRCLPRLWRTGERASDQDPWGQPQQGHYQTPHLTPHGRPQGSLQGAETQDSRPAPVPPGRPLPTRATVVALDQALWLLSRATHTSGPQPGRPDSRHLANGNGPSHLGRATLGRGQLGEEALEIVGASEQCAVQTP